MTTIPDPQSAPATHSVEYDVQPPRLPGRRRWRNGCLWMLLVGSLLLVVPIFLVGVALLAYLLFPPAPLDVLLLGMDARQGEGFVARTDSIMLLGVNPEDLQAALLSIPRDIFVQVPGYDQLQRINTLNVLGEQNEAGAGPELVQAAVEASFGVEVDRYVRITFDSFTALIDALGGIDIEVPYRLVDSLYPTDDYGTTTVVFEPGWQHMDGERALAYARTRHADDDYRRAERQQQVLAATLQAMVSPENWPRLPAALQAFFSAVDTDMTLYDVLITVPPLLFDGAAGEMDRLVIGRDLIQRTAGGYAVPNYPLITPWLEAHFD
jgi:LCP family protein required for cell wall assembly